MFFGAKLDQVRSNTVLPSGVEGSSIALAASRQKSREGIGRSDVDLPDLLWTDCILVIVISSFFTRGGRLLEVGR